MLEGRGGRPKRLRRGTLRDGQSQVEAVIDDEPVSRWHHRRRLALLHDHGPLEGVPRPQRVALVDRRLHPASGLAEPGAAMGLGRDARGRITSQRGHPVGTVDSDVCGANRGGGTRAEDAPVDGLDHGAGVEVSVEPRIFGRERIVDGAQVLARERRGGQRHRDVVNLAEQTHLGSSRDGDFARRDVGVGQQRAPLRLQIAEQGVDRVEIQLVEHARQRGDELEADGRHEETERRGRTRCRRDQDLAHAEDARDTGRVRGAGAAESEHRVTPGVASLLDDVDAGGGGHALADDRVDTPRRVDGGQPEWLGHAGQRGLRRGPVKTHASAQEEVGIEVAQQQVGVGDRRLLATETVTGGPGIGPGASGAHLEQTELVYVRDAAAPRADLDHVDHGRLDRQTAALLEAVDARGLHHGRHVGPAALDQACLGGGAAHVERDHIAVVRLGAEKRRGQPAAGRSRLQQSHGEFARHAR